MALRPSGPPSTQPPPSPPPPTGHPRPARERRPSATAQSAMTSVVRWAALVGGIVIIADLSTQAIIQRSISPDDVGLVTALDQIVNYVLFSVLGVIVVRETRLFYLGVVAGFLAAVLDGTVIAAASVMAGLAGPGNTVEELFALNVLIGTVFAGLSGLVYAVVQLWTRGRTNR